MNLKAVSDVDGKEYISYVKRNYDFMKANRKSFHCIGCGGRVSFIDMFCRIKHFRHDIDDPSCCYGKEQTEEHIEMKKFFMECLNLPDNCLEYRGLIDKGVRPDVFIPELNIAIECQASGLDRSTIIERTQKYSRLGVYVFWIFHEKLFNGIHIKDFIMVSSDWGMDFVCVYGGKSIFMRYCGIEYDVDVVDLPKHYDLSIKDFDKFVKYDDEIENDFLVVVLTDIKKFIKQQEKRIEMLKERKKRDDELEEKKRIEKEQKLKKDYEKEQKDIEELSNKYLFLFMNLNVKGFNSFLESDFKKAQLKKGDSLYFIVSALMLKVKSGDIQRVWDKNVFDFRLSIVEKDEKNSSHKKDVVFEGESDVMCEIVYALKDRYAYKGVLLKVIPEGSSFKNLEDIKNSIDEMWGVFDEYAIKNKWSNEETHKKEKDIQYILNKENDNMKYYDLKWFLNKMLENISKEKKYSDKII